MVDFQSRDTRRDPTDDEESDSDEQDDAADTNGDRPESKAETAEYDPDAGDDGLSYAVVTVSDDLTLDSDDAGNAVVESIQTTEDAVATRDLVSASYDGVQSSLSALVDRRDVDAIVTVGGTGVEPDDVTVDAATDLFDKRLPGFGELFRIHSHDYDGSAVIRTRATAGVVEDAPVFCLPGDAESARRGVEGIILDEAPELVALARDGEPESTDDDGSSLL